jgi:hypothetical protein
MEKIHFEAMKIEGKSSEKISKIEKDEPCDTPDDRLHFQTKAFHNLYQ